MSKRIVNRTLYAAVVTALYSSAGLAQQTPAASSALQEIDTVVITGSIIRGTATDTALPVETFTMEDLEKQGSPSPLEFVKSLTASGPTTGEAYYFSGSALTNDVRFNLRGIGADKTLTIFNGRRAFQNAAVYPSIALQNIDVLKDGAAVTYGADATGGVVNMVSLKSFEGFKATSNYKTYKGSEQGEWKLAGMLGFKTDFADIIFAAEWDHKSELDTSEREFSTKPYWVNPAPASQLTNVGAWLPRGTLPSTVTIAPGAVGPRGDGEWGAPIAGLSYDFTPASCEAVGGTFVGRIDAATSNFNKCAYNYIPYYNLVEENDVYRLFAQLNTKLSEDIDFTLRALWARNYSPHQYGSPSQPVIRGPAITTGAAYQLYVPGTNPYVAAFRARTGAPAATGYTPVTYRAFAHGGNDTFASGNNHSVPNENDTQYWHVTAGANGEISEYLNFDFGATFNQFVSVNSQPDIHGFRLQNALNGFGGPNCNAADLDPVRPGIQNPGAAGTNGCMWYNPFASNFAAQPTLGLTNPAYIAGAENPKELVEWLFNKRESENTTYDFTVDLIFSGTTPFALPGGDVAWGAGAQWRSTKNRETVEDPLYNGQTPCDWPGQNPASTSDPLFTGCTLDRAGPYLFFANNPPDATEQKQQSMFLEVSLPIHDMFSLTAAGRYEKFTPINLDATVYKVSAKFQPIDQFALRGSYGTNYQAPGAGIIPGQLTNGVASYTAAGGAWLGSQTETLEGIKPETATVWNLGAIVQLEFGSDQNLNLTLDYFNIKTKDELGLVASTNDLATFLFDEGTGAVKTISAANCASPLMSRVTLNVACTAGVAANQIASIRTDFGNGPGQHTTGFDLQANYGFGLGGGELSFITTVTKLMKLESEAVVLDGVEIKKRDDRLGYLNFATVAQAAPEWKANFSVNYSFDTHNIRATVNYVSGVDDERYINANGSMCVSRLEFHSDGEDPSLRCDKGIVSTVPEGFYPGTAPNYAGTPQVTSTINGNNQPSDYGVFGKDWLSIDLHYLWRSEIVNVGFSVQNMFDRDPPASRQEFGYDPRIGNPYGRQFELSLSKQF